MNINRYITFIRSELKKGQYCLYLLLLLLLTINCHTIYSQVCDPEIRPVKGWELRYRERGNRCEGFYVAHPVGKFLEVVGVVAGRFHFTLDEEEVLNISSPVILDHLIHVRAVGLPVKIYYRMDAQLEPRQVLIWPVRDVIYPQKLSDNEIGVFGWIGEETEQTYVPITIAPTIAPVENDGKIRLYLRSTGDVLEKAMWRSSDEVDGGCSGLNESTWNNISISSEQPWEPFQITVPSSETGILCVEIVAKSRRTREWGRRNIRVIVGPVKR